MQVAYCVVHHDQKKQQRGQFKVGATPTRQPTPLAYDAGARVANHVCDADAMNCWSCEVHQWISKWWLRREWNDMNISMHNWPNESIIESMRSELVSRWINDSVNQWSSESLHRSMNRWFSELLTEWITVSMNQWISEQMTQRINGWIWVDESINRCINESMIQWINE